MSLSICPRGSVAISNSSTPCVYLTLSPNLRCAAMPPKQMKGESSSFSLTPWMTTKPRADGAEQQNAEHEKTGDQTPSPTEVVDSSQKTPSPTEVADSPEIDHEAKWMEQHVAYKNNDNDDDYNDGVATDEAAAIAEAMAQAAAQNVTMQVLMANKRPREEENAEPEVGLVSKHIGGGGARQFCPICPICPICPCPRAPGGPKSRKVLWSLWSPRVFHQSAMVTPMVTPMVTSFSEQKQGEIG